MCILASVSWLWFKVSFCLFGHTRDTSVTFEKAKFVCITYLQQQKIKLTSVKINMKQVSYMMCFRGVDIAILN